MKLNVLFDFSNMAFRSLFIIGQYGLKDNYKSQRDNSKFVYKLAQDLSYMTREYAPHSRVILALDHKNPWRKDLLKNEPVGYKEQRERDETMAWDNIFASMDDFLKIVDGKMLTTRIPTAEGDDIIALYKEHFFNNTEDESVLIVSADADIRQLADFKEDTKQFCAILNPIANWRKKKRDFYITKEALDYVNQAVEVKESADPVQQLMAMFNSSSGKATTNTTTRDMVGDIIKKKDISTHVIDPEEVVLSKIFCGDDSDNIPALYGFFNHNNNWIRITPSRYKKIVDEMRLENVDDLFAKQPMLLDAIENAMKSRPSDSIFPKLERQRRLVELKSELFPPEIVDTFLDNVSESLMESNHVTHTYQTMSAKALLNDSKYEDGGSTTVANSMFKDIEKYLNS